MPALVTHHLFGEDAATRLPVGLLATEEELLAFLLANQGPDPFFARMLARPKVVRSCRRLAREMHAGHVVEALMAARTAAAHLPPGAQGLGRAFALGLLAHYVLDSRTHPFVYAQQAALVSANPGLRGLEGGVHAVIESDLDAWMLWSQRGLTVADVPTTENLACTDRVAHVGGALFAQVAAQVFDISIAAGEYGAAVGDYRRVCAIIDPADATRSRFVARVERLVRPYAHSAALAHRVTTSDECAAANLSCNEWTDPCTGIVSNLSFGDLYVEALDAWPPLAEAFVRGETATLEALAGGVNYDGVFAGA